MTNLMLASLAFVIAALCAGIMGFAIQRGATCTVAAVDEIVSRRRGQRLVALVEASLWVAGGLVIANAAGVLGTMPAGFAVGAATLAGGVLLGIGAFVNRACVFGAIARLGSGEWAYVATPAGFFFGCYSLPYVFSLAVPSKIAHGSAVLQAPRWVAVAVAVVMLARIAATFRSRGGGREAAPARQHWHDALSAKIWSPHTATTVIGITFVVLLLLAGAWAYTDVLAELARGMSGNLFARGLLLVALFGGAALGGWTAGRLRSTRVTAGQVLRCFAGGTLMGWGSLLIPGGNDGLILVGMPLLWPYAWIAFLTMGVSIAAALLLQRSLAGTPRREADSPGH